MLTASRGTFRTNFGDKENAMSRRRIESKEELPNTPRRLSEVCETENVIFLGGGAWSEERKREVRDAIQAEIEAVVRKRGRGGRRTRG